GDGSPLSSNANPGHLYALTGTYTVTLSVTNTLGTDAVSGVVEILEADAVPDIFLPLLLLNYWEAIEP
ncbi:MAG: PKD domain-containing protein, partial [Candidatus Promineifilaceae bacterium]